MTDEFEYNMNAKRRKEIIHSYASGIRQTPYGLVYFSGISRSALKILMDEKFIDPDMTKNDAPSTQEIYDLLCKYPDCFRAHGFYTTKKRGDYLIVLEGVTATCHDFETLNKCAEAMKETFGKADELDFNLVCWFD